MAMRADRLLSLLLLLQSRGKMTAEALAGELEVSVRTIYRDLDALSAAGVPVYADRGPGGGCTLLDNYRTQLTGLREDEVRALFMAGAPAALAELGFGAELKTAMLKLLAALPSERQGDERWVRQRILLDWERSPADSNDQPVAHLHTIQAAVWTDHCLRIHYRRESSFYRRQFSRLVEPYGLVAQAGVWHLVCAAAGRIRVYSVNELLAVETTDSAFARPADFDLPTFWGQWRQKKSEEQGHFLVQVRTSPAMAAELPLRLGETVRKEITTMSGAEWQVGHQADWQRFLLQFDSFDEARTKLLGLGAGMEIETPAALRLSVLDYAQQVVQLYSRH
jgi:predicted DNA-binding transcriptional regulator YafY